MMRQRVRPTEALLLWRKLRDEEPTRRAQIPPLQTCDAETAVRLIHDAVAPHQAELQPPTGGLMLMGLVLPLMRLAPDSLKLLAVGVQIVVLLSVLIPFLPECKKRRQRTERLMGILSELLPECRSTQILPELLDLLGWLNHAANSVAKTALRESVAQLLTRASEDELSELLTPERRQLLRTLCANPTTEPDLVRAALLVLGSVRDEKTVPIAQKLLRKPVLRDAAEAFLDEVR